jgi:hypothetical protein
MKSADQSWLDLHYTGAMRSADQSASELQFVPVGGGAADQALTELQQHRVRRANYFPSADHPEGELQTTSAADQLVVELQERGVCRATSIKEFRRKPLRPCTRAFDRKHGLPKVRRGRGAGSVARSRSIFK